MVDLGFLLDTSFFFLYINSPGLFNKNSNDNAYKFTYRVLFRDTTHPRRALPMNWLIQPCISTDNQLLYNEGKSTIYNLQFTAEQ